MKNDSFEKVVYGLAKVTGTPTYKIGKFLVPILKDLRLVWFC